MALLREMKLLPVSVRADADFLDAARLLLDAHTSAVAVVDRDQRVVGLFTDDDLLRGLFPSYLGELHHTAFLVDEGKVLQASLDAVAGEAVARWMRDPVTVEIDAGAAHVVERFLHTPWGALAVVEAGRFVGMLGQLEFTQRLIEQLDLRD
jgi:CBS domain-containing protein